MTYSILSYVKWSHPNPNICIIDNSAIYGEFNQTIISKKSDMKVLNVSDKDLNQYKCDAVFFSQHSATEEQKIINGLKIPPALSFSTNNSDCEIGSVFCLYTTKSGKSLFKVNLDSLAKTKIHIDPRVLLLAQQSE